MSKVRSVFGALLAAEIIWWAFFCFSTSVLPDEGYFHMRQATHIRETGFPLLHDNLSYGGRDFIVLPLFDYFIAFFSLFVEMIQAVKIASFFLIISIMILVFLVSNIITGNTTSALFSTALSGMAPSIIYNFSSSSLLGVVLSLALIFLISESVTKTNIVLLGALLLALILSSSLYFVFILSILLYIFFIKIEGIKHTIGELELVLCAVFIGAWGSMILFRDAIFLNGSAALFGNVPQQIRTQLPTAVSLAFSIGLIPFITGIYATFNYVFIKRNKPIYLCVSLLLVSFFLASLSMLPVKEGIILASFLFCILSSFVWRDFFFWVEKTKASSFKTQIQLTFILLIAVSGIIVFSAETKIFYSSLSTKSDIIAMNWMLANLLPNEKVMALYDEGNAITALSKHPVVIDSSFLLVKDPQEVFNDASIIFKTYETESVRIMNTYNASILFFSERAQVSNPEPDYFSNKECFELLYNSKSQIYRSKCRWVES